MHEHKNLMGALLKAKAAMGTLTKDAKNPHFKSTYASLAAVVDVLRQPLTDSGIVYIESPVPELEPGRIAIDLTICHAASGESITYRSPVMVAQQQTPQAIGSALTYARRYQLMTVFGLAPEDDDGNESTKAQTPRQQPQRQTPPVAPVTPTNGTRRNPAEDMPEVMQQSETPIYNEQNGIVVANHRKPAAPSADVNEAWPPFHPEGDEPFTKADGHTFKGKPDAILWGASRGVFANKHECAASFEKNATGGKTWPETCALWIAHVRTKLMTQGTPADNPFDAEPVTA
jgi:hypothetical protein